MIGPAIPSAEPPNPSAPFDERDRIDAFVHRFEPAATPEPSPALLLLHGTGGDETDLLALGRAVAPGRALLSPRGRVLENGMPRFFRRHAEGVFDERDLREQTTALADWLVVAAGRYGLNGGLVALGFSNGANMAASLLLLRPETLAGAVLLRPMVLPFDAEAPTPAGPAKPVLIVSGRADPIVPADQPERLAGQLRRTGAAVTLAWRRAGHGLSADEPPLVAEFLATPSSVAASA